MSAIEVKGGVPHNLMAAVTGTAAGFAAATVGGMPSGNTKHLALQNEGAVAVRVAWSEAEMTAGAYFTLYPNNDPAGRDRWQGPVELTADRDKVWLQTASSTSNVLITFFQRRG
jgi:hypothetical protein